MTKKWENVKVTRQSLCSVHWQFHGHVQSYNDDLLGLAARGCITTHTYIHEVKKNYAYRLSTFTQSSLEVTLEVRKWMWCERVLKSVCLCANSWIFHRRSQSGYKLSITFNGSQIMEHVGLASYLSKQCTAQARMYIFSCVVSLSPKWNLGENNAVEKINNFIGDLREALLVPGGQWWRGQEEPRNVRKKNSVYHLSLIHIWRCRRRG